MFRSWHACGQVMQVRGSMEDGLQQGCCSGTGDTGAISTWDSS
jgi:hypothetical protein